LERWLGIFSLIMTTRRSRRKLTPINRKIMEPRDKAKGPK